MTTITIQTNNEKGPMGLFFDKKRREGLVEYEKKKGS